MKHYSCLVGDSRFYGAALFNATPLSTQKELGKALVKREKWKTLQGDLDFADFSDTMLQQWYFSVLRS